MDWQTLGQITLSYQWQEIGNPVDQIELFRLNHLGVVPTSGKGWIAQSFGSPPEIYGVQVFYPVPYKPTLRLAIPEDLILRGLTSRKIVLKIATYAPLPKTDWQVAVETLAPTVPPQESTFEQLNRISSGLARIEYKLDNPQ